MTFWRCPVHSLMESPRLMAIPEWDRDPDMPTSGPVRICPFNLTTDESGITDDLCQRVVTGPYRGLAVMLR